MSKHGSLNSRDPKTFYSYGFLPLDKLLVPEEYQRAINENRMQRIVSDFNPLAVGALIVIKRRRKNGRGFDYYLMDGGHRQGVLYTMGYTHWHCLIIEGDLELWEEARAWKGYNSNRANGTPLEVYNSDITEGAEQAIDIKKAVEKRGWKVSGPSKRSARDRRYGDISAIAALRYIHSRVGRIGLDTVLRVVDESWGVYEDPRIHHADFLRAVTKVIAHEAIQDNPEKGVDRLISKLSKVLPSKIESIAKSRREQSRETKTVSIAVEIAKEYNKGIPKGRQGRVII